MNNNNDYRGVVLVIGNGFDLDVGLRTKYSHFANSDEWEQMYNDNVTKSKHYSLLKFLNDKKEIDTWFDIEQALLEYASVKTKDVWHHDVETDKREYSLVCDTLKSYLNRQIERPPRDIDKKWSVRLLSKLYHFDDVDKTLYTFNYTPIIKIARRTDIMHLANPQYVHGKMEDNTHIMGIDVSSLDEIIPEYSFLIKSNNKSYHATNIESDMINAKEVIIFGHSLNMIDAVYFDDYLKDLSANKYDERRLTFITFNENSKLQILDNIRKMGISVPKLYSHGHLDFVLTDNKSDRAAFDNLLNRFNT